IWHSTGLRFVSRLQTRGNHEISEPEGRGGIHRIRLVVGAVVPVPRRSAPSPTVGHWSGPRIISPSIICGVVVVRGIVAVVTAVASVSVGTKNARLGHVIDPIRALHVGAAAALEVWTLHISATLSNGHDPRAVARAHDPAAAVNSVFNVHPVTIDGTDLAIGTDVRRAPSLQRYLFPGGRMRTSGVRASRPFPG